MIPQGLLPILRASLVVAGFASCSAAMAQQIPADREDAALAYAQCMRENGYAEFPDPTPEGGIRFLIKPDSAPRFEAAAAACRDLAPEGLRNEDLSPEDIEALLRFSQCMRENGLPDFPDPDSEGGFSPRSMGMGPDDPRFAAAMATCREEVGLRRGGQIRIGG